MMLSGGRRMGVLGWQHGTYRPLFPIFEGMYSVPTVFITIIFLPAHHPSVILLSPHYPTHDAESTNHTSMGISRCSPLLTPKDTHPKATIAYIWKVLISIWTKPLSLSLSPPLFHSLYSSISFSLTHNANVRQKYGYGFEYISDGSPQRCWCW